MLTYSENCEANVESQAQQSPESQKPSAPIPSRSKKTKRKEKCQAFAFNRYAPDAFGDFAEETSSQGRLSLAQVSESLLQPLRLLQIIHSHLNNLRLIHKTILPQTHKR